MRPIQPGAVTRACGVLTLGWLVFWSVIFVAVLPRAPETLVSEAGVVMVAILFAPLYLCAVAFYVLRYIFYGTFQPRALAEPKDKRWTVDAEWADD